MNESGVALHANLPLAWRPASAFSPQQITDWMHDNHVTLQALAALESPAHEKDMDSTTSFDHGTTRLEAKVDLLLQLVGDLIRRQHPLPPGTDVILHAHQIKWMSENPLVPNTEGVVTLYLSPRLPWPLNLPVKILDMQGTHIHATLTHLTDETQDWLDRTLFRYHRRALQHRSK